MLLLALRANTSITLTVPFNVDVQTTAAGAEMRYPPRSSRADNVLFWYTQCNSVRDALTPKTSIRCTPLSSQHMQPDEWSRQNSQELISASPCLSYQMPHRFHRS